MMNNHKPLYIVGAGALGREVAWLVETINEKKQEWDIKGFVDADSTLWNTELDGYFVHGDIDIFESMTSDVWCVIAIGNAKIREKLAERISAYSCIKYATLIAPGVKIGLNSIVEEGSIICAGTIISVDVHIGKHDIVDWNSTIGHDTELDDYVTLYPSVNVSGRVTIGHTTEIGTGTQIIQGISVGTGTIIGAGAVVIKDIESEVTAVGCPAYIVKRHTLE